MPDDPLATNSMLELDIALAHCAEAALAWSNPTRRSDALPLLMAAMTTLARANHARPPAISPHEFARLLRTPASSWLAGAPAECLVENGRPSTYALDLICENGDDPEAELVQSRVGASRATFATRPNGATEYTLFRRFLVEHAFVRRIEAMRALGPSGIPFAELYEPVPTRCLVQHEATQTFLPCPRCTWPMSRTQDELLECSSKVCQMTGARYRLSGSHLVPLGQAPAPHAVSADGRVQLRRGAWRYTLLPGLIELELSRRLESLRDVRVELWPYYDAYDLDVQYGSRRWKVDVKDWTSATALTRRLRRRPPSDAVRIIIPDERRPHLRVLRERCLDLAIVFQTTSDVFDEVQRAVAETGGS